MPQTSEGRYVAIVEAPIVQGMCEILKIELRIVAGARDCSYVRKSPNAMCLQDLKEFGDRAGRMADGEDAQCRHVLQAPSVNFITITTRSHET